LENQLGFSKFPHYVILSKPITIKQKNGAKTKIGNLYLHFATKEPKGEVFYKRLLNDYLLVWLHEEGAETIKIITENAVDVATKEFVYYYLPLFWANKEKTYKEIADSNIYNKIDTKFVHSNCTIREYYDSIFKHNNFNLKYVLEKKEGLFDENFLKLIFIAKQLKINDRVNDPTFNGTYTKFLKNAGVKKSVEHDIFISLEEPDIERFVNLLFIRNVINLLMCCFDFGEKDVKYLLCGSGTSALSTYFTKYFFYKPVLCQKEYVYKFASKREQEFLQSLVYKMSSIFSQSEILEYNKWAVTELQIKEHTSLDKSDYVSRSEVYDFKTKWCNENDIIPKLLKEKAEQYLVAPILDCGAGLGDIAFQAFPNKEAILLDVNPIQDPATPTSLNHKVVIKSIFDFSPEKPINTLLISHTLQFIDSDIERLNKQIAILNPKYIIIVLNENDDIMGELIKWTKENYKVSNPEEKIDGFPVGYKCIEHIPFKAQVSCKTHEQLAKQISYLMMIDLSETGDKLKSYLESILEIPSFEFNQAVEIHQRLNF
jgi:hypothetical protein